MASSASSISINVNGGALRAIFAHHSSLVADA